MFGANEGEGIMALDMTLSLYIRPNGLENDTNFWKYDAVRTVMGALGIFIRDITLRHKFFVREDSFDLFQVSATTPELCQML